MEHYEQIKAIVWEVLHVGHLQCHRQDWGVAWAEIRRRLREQRDTTTTLREDERTALQILRQL